MHNYKCAPSSIGHGKEKSVLSRKGLPLISLPFDHFVLSLEQCITLLNRATDICCDPSLEPSRRDGSNDGSQNMYL